MRPKTILFLIFIVALVIRFLFFRESVYFGFDEARDAYISQNIYLQGDFKIIGPPANFPGLFHGPLYWYLIGPLYLLGKGNPLVVSGVFRIVNALGVLVVFAISKKLFNTKAGLISSFIYALSFEQTQYAMYVGNPSLAIFAWDAIFWGAAILLKDKNPNGLIWMFLGASFATQFELIFLYCFGLILVILFLLRKNLKGIKPLKWVQVFSLTLLALSTFVVSEILFNFQLSRAFVNLFQKGYSVMQAGDNRITLFVKMFSKLWQYNIINIPVPFVYIFVFVGVLVLFWFGKKEFPVRLILVWILGGLFIIPFGGYDALYVNTGIGVGVIIASGFLIGKVWGKVPLVALSLLLIISLSNFLLIKKYNPNGLIVEIKAQQFMKLADEEKLIDKIYTQAGGKGFTIRVTSMPYRIQTVWAYLFEFYGQRDYGYLPYWETEEVAGYPGKLPRPTKGTTCVRFLIREPVRGIPQGLIDNDIAEENFFSKVIKEEYVGKFLLQTRQAKGACHDEYAKI